jgi:uncharacterized membrane protein
MIYLLACKLLKKAGRPNVIGGIQANATSKEGDSMSAYKKEAYITVGFFVAYVLMAHTGPWAIILGIDNSVRVLGYPLHYFIALVLGWFGVLAVSIVWNRMADQLEEEIAMEADTVESTAEDMSPAAVIARQGSVAEVAR